MATHNSELWQTVTFLFLSKFSPKTGKPFAQKMLINAKNVELAQRFAEMVGDTTKGDKTKLALIKALRQLEQHGWVERIDDSTIQLTDTGITKMNNEVQSAMKKIAASFPDAANTEKPAPVMR
ncbi:MAG: hypothetical protein B6I36_05720 [Desulfobacteraceae bacterium 4572_35.1]|nr:MAG: hypothetical protein B6I36_05720 [Desulfobacteraceae bacterium 4572_35.1]